MKKLLLFTSLVVFAASAHAQNSRSKPVSLKVEGIGLGASYESVTSKFGKPVMVKNGDAEPCVGGKSRKLLYSGLTFDLTDDPKTGKFFVDRFELTVSRWAASGVKIGATTTAIKTKFGKPRSVENGENGEKVWYYDLPKNESGGSNFYFKNGKLTRVVAFYMQC